MTTLEHCFGPLAGATGGVQDMQIETPCGRSPYVEIALGNTATVDFCGVQI